MFAMAAPKKKSTGGRPKAADPKRSLISLKGGAKYEEWLNGLVAHENLSPTVILELALREYATNRGYKLPQPKR